MRIAPLTAAVLGLSLAFSAPPAFAAKKAVASQHQKCANLDGDSVTVTGTALGATFNAGRDETYFMVVKSDSPCDAIDVTVKGPLDCGADRQVRVEGKLTYDDDKIVSAHIDQGNALCAQPANQSPATAAVPAAPTLTPVPSAAPPTAPPPAPTVPKTGAETPDFYKVQ